VRSADLVEGIPEIDFEQGQVRTLMPLNGIAKRMCHHLHSPRASNPIVPVLESSFDLLLARDAEALGHQPADGVTAT
jgi:hypothetical protein